jgi:hypothetical protein
VFSAWRRRRSRSSHDPLHSDDFLDAHFGTALEEWARMGGDPTALEMATERRELELGAPPTPLKARV